MFDPLSFFIHLCKFSLQNGPLASPPLCYINTSFFFRKDFFFHIVMHTNFLNSFRINWSFNSLVSVSYSLIFSRVCTIFIYLFIFCLCCYCFPNVELPFLNNASTFSVWPISFFFQMNKILKSKNRSATTGSAIVSYFVVDLFCLWKASPLSFGIDDSLSNSWGYTNADLKVCWYLRLGMEIICRRFHIITPFYFLRYANVSYVKCLFRNIQKQ